MDERKLSVLNDLSIRAEELYDDVMLGKNMPLSTFPSVLHDDHSTFSAGQAYDRVYDDVLIALQEEGNLGFDEAKMLTDKWLLTAIDELYQEVEDEMNAEISLSGTVFYPSGFNSYTDDDEYINDTHYFILDYIGTDGDLTSVLFLGSQREDVDLDMLETHFPELNFEDDDVQTLETKVDEIMDDANSEKEIVVDYLKSIADDADYANNLFEDKLKDITNIARIIVE